MFNGKKSRKSVTSDILETVKVEVVKRYPLLENNTIIEKQNYVTLTHIYPSVEEAKFNYEKYFMPNIVVNN